MTDERDRFEGTRWNEPVDLGDDTKTVRREGDFTEPLEAKTPPLVFDYPESEAKTIDEYDAEARRRPDIDEAIDEALAPFADLAGEESRTPQPWDEHIDQARESFLDELRTAITSTTRATRWAETLPVSKWTAETDVLRHLREASSALNQVYNRLKP